MCIVREKGYFCFLLCNRELSVIAKCVPRIFIDLNTNTRIVSKQFLEF